MGAAVAGLFGATMLGGILLLVAGSRQVERAPKALRERGRLETWWRQLTKVRRVWLVAVLVASVVVFSLTGWVAALVLVPFAGLALPTLLRDPGNRDIELLQVLDRWVRGLAASLPTGKSLSDAIRSTAGQAPAIIAPTVRRLIIRIDERWSLRDALLSMADELASADADAVVAAMVIAAERGGIGATTTLNALSDTIQHRLGAAREIEAERAKPRIVVRQVTLVTLVTIAGAALLGPSYFEPFSGPVGQVLVVALGLAYFGSLLGLRRLGIPRSRDRILQVRVGREGVAHA